MKKLIFTFSFLFTIIVLNGQTATNFNCNDCAGTNHDLFAELNSGKVIVISFVMPCSSCIAPSVSAYNEVQNYSGTNPGQVFFYIIDDYGNTNCTTLTNWCNANGLGNAIRISNTSVTETPYGSGGMPKILVIGGSSHTVFYNQNGPINVSAFNAAINNALAASSVSIKENISENFQLSFFPNPVTDKKVSVSYQLKRSEEVSIEVYNTIGAKVKTVLKEKQVVGKHEQYVDLSALPIGIYFIKLQSGDKTDVLKFLIPE